MKKTILVAGRDKSGILDFIDGLSLFERNISVTDAFVEEEPVKKTIAERKASVASYIQSKETEAKTGVCSFEWNKGSALSSRSLVLQTESAFSSFDEALLFFDEEYFASAAGKVDVEEISRSTDEMILGFQNLTLEVLNRFEKKKSEDFPGTLVFMIKSCPCVSDAVKSPSLRNGSSAIASPLVAAAAGAFVSFAENIAALYGDLPYVNIILVRQDFSAESMRMEDCGRWFGKYLNELSENKVVLNAKKSLSWIKPGAKAGGLRSALKKTFLK